MRMRSNRVVMFNNDKVAIRDIRALRPKGTQKARTLKAIWNNLALYITADRRVDKKGIYTVVYQVATYKAKPTSHVQHYRRRWGIEKLNRTTKQCAGLKDCYST